MSRHSDIHSSETLSPLAMLLPIVVVVFSAFLVIGMAMPALPLHVHDGLGLSSFFVGLVAGAQFAASLISRLWSGHYTDHRGAKEAVIAGLLVVAVSGALYCLSLAFAATPQWSIGVLLVGRGLLGGAESFIITDALVAESSGIPTVFFISSLVVLSAAAIAIHLALTDRCIAQVSMPSSS